MGGVIHIFIHIYICVCVIPFMKYHIVVYCGYNMGYAI